MAMAAIETLDFMHDGAGTYHGPMNTVEELLAREAARARALVERDSDTLAALLADDLLHVHSTGQMHRKDAYLAYVRGPLAFLSIERRGLEVTMLGKAALMTGAMSNVMQPPGPVVPVTVHSHVVQLWTASPAGWRLAVFQATRLPAMDQ
jgi:hypothetical protein